MVVVYHILGCIGAYGVYETIQRSYSEIKLFYIAFTKPETQSIQTSDLVELALMLLARELMALFLFLLLTIWSIRRIYAPLGKGVIEAERKKRDSLNVSATEASRHTDSKRKD